MPTHSADPAGVRPLYPRLLRPRVAEALADTPVVLVSGPRQAGKTTLVKTFLDDGRHYLTLDDAAVRTAAREDPHGLVRSLDRSVIDEIQRAPELLLAIKQSIDERRVPGRFLLTGSANVMTVPAVADSLAGRMENLVLLPLAQCEISPEPGASPGWLDALFSGKIPVPAHPGSATQVGESLAQRVLRGGYPESLIRPTARRRQAWARQYLDTLIERDVRDIATLDKLDHLPRLLNVLAHVSGQLCNYSQLAGQVGLDLKTAGKYLAVFEQMFLLQRLPVWAGNHLTRLVKTPKIQFLDAGLLAALLEIEEVSPLVNRQAFGRLLETFVFSELLKQQSWAERRYGLYYYRDKDQVEVDFVIENAAGAIVGVEVKAAASVGGADLAPLRKLARLLPDRFMAGLVLYDGTRTLPLGDRLWAVPVSTLWGSTLETA